MRATGIVKRIDNFGRIVIPKEIRRTFHIPEGEPMEIFTEADGSIILRKYSPLKGIEDLADICAETLGKTTLHSVMLTDRNSIITVYGFHTTNFLHKNIGNAVIHLIESCDFAPVVTDRGVIYTDEVLPQLSYLICPIKMYKSTLGTVILVAKENTVFTEADQIAGKTIATLLANYLE